MKTYLIIYPPAVKKVAMENHPLISEISQPRFIPQPFDEVKTTPKNMDGVTINNIPSKKNLKRRPCAGTSWHFGTECEILRCFFAYLASILMLPEF